ncbi:flagellar hook-associated protein FlgL [Anaerobacillus isosaccharinicus]|uniref:Flagellar hook protein n=1 Tax=Anaerobacillus isosaccharinicus TaxID=1532552 RepID=A0A1S2LB71_9BACI|nr:flagellar hook-associated protein FlgL [Anaerobacillus isosaccharinicus]MBA5584607.1 flagellar hook-associated protein FlgL [Anaerobacillus isosaccharinicus]QOY37014.1 flagellar hook-associated protein FlgL [Anaerobacillus isosaccharinicus]
MRITQTMLANNSLRHMSNSYKSLSNIQDQLATGKKISRASQDPVVAMNGMRYRTQVTEVEQFKRNLGEVYNWMDTADATLDKVTQSLHRIRELTVQASNDTYESTQRANMSKEVEQLREHLIALANTKSNNKFIFNGTNTTNAPVDATKMNLSVDVLKPGSPDLKSLELTYNGELYTFDKDDTFISATGKTLSIADVDGAINISHKYLEKDNNEITQSLKINDIVISDRTAVSTNGQKVEIEVLKGVNIAVNINPANVFSNDFFGELIRLEKALQDPTSKSEDLTKFLNTLSTQMDKVVNERAELGARVNRVEMIEDRVMEQEVIAKRILSNNEDADMEKVIIDLKTQESVHRAALAAGARIIQPTLMDFLR